jgi:SAM-dependent methyltransferase
MEALLRKQVRINQLFWDELAIAQEPLCRRIATTLRAGRSSLRHIELTQMGDIDGASLAHAHCFTGMDTISWARKGARAVGLDFSPRAIALATRLAQDLDVDCRFIVSDLSAQLSTGERYDFVYAAYGIIEWIPDLPSWFRTMVSLMRPRARFFLVDSHPVASIMSTQSTEGLIHLLGGRHYFSSGVAHCRRARPAIVAPGASARNLYFRWFHSLAAVLSAAQAAGLTIKNFCEYPFSHYKKFDFLERREDGYFYWPDDSVALPLTFSLMAVLGESVGG